jgi:site-specific recombinase XerC
LLRDGVGEATIRRALAVLQSILTMAVTDELIASNPVAKVRKPGEALALAWTDVGKRALRVRRSISLGEETTTKTRAARSVRLLAPLAEDST